MSKVKNLMVNEVSRFFLMVICNNILCVHVHVDWNTLPVSANSEMGTINVFIFFIYLFIFI